MSTKKIKAKRAQPARSALFAAYRGTVYVAHAGARTIVLNYRSKCRELDQLLKQKKLKTALFITGWNPMSVSTPAKNAAFNKKLLKLLSKRYSNIYNGCGIGEVPTWAPEHSYMVLGVKKTDAFAIAKAFKQAAFGFYESGSYEIVDTGI